MSEHVSPLEREILSGRPVVTLTSGDSMEPLLYHQSTRVVVMKVQGDLQKGDLPVYKRPAGKFVMHRIIRIDKEAYYTRGDHRCGLERVPKEWVLGVVTEIYRKKRHFSVNHTGYRLYVRVWNTIYPIRWAVYQTKTRIKRWKNKKIQ